MLISIKRNVTTFYLLAIMVFLIFACKSEKQEENQFENKNDKKLKDDVIQESGINVKYGFESGTEGWIFQNWYDTQGVIRVEQTEAYSRSGKYSLHLDCNLNGNIKANRKGEAYVDLRSTPPEGICAPLNLEGKEIKCWFMIPNTLAGGDPHRPNGIQLFVKSVYNEGATNEQWFSQYGTWYNIPGRTGSWFEIKLEPSLKNPKWGYTEQGFDPSKIVVIGVKIAIGTGSSASFKGSIFIDDIEWQ